MSVFIEILWIKLINIRASMMHFVISVLGIPVS